jgi:hypothetical protein
MQPEPNFVYRTGIYAVFATVPKASTNGHLQTFRVIS